MFIYDVFHRRVNPKISILANYLAFVHSSWTAMSAQEFKALDVHITGCDFPEAFGAFRQWPEEIGVKQFTWLWKGEWHSHKRLQLNLN